MSMENPAVVGCGSLVLSLRNRVRYQSVNRESNGPSSLELAV
jgi:hypothetical protein